jgi:hypothetical protein
MKKPRRALHAPGEASWLSGLDLLEQRANTCTRYVAAEFCDPSTESQVEKRQAFRLITPGTYCLLSM